MMYSTGRTETLMDISLMVSGGRQLAELRRLEKVRKEKYRFVLPRKF